MSQRQNERMRTDKYYNLHIVNEYDCGYDGVPELKWQDSNPKRLVGFNYALSMKRERKKGSYCHFFLDDYQFERTWRHPEQYLKTLSEFDGVLTPDFSLYADMPMPMQRWNIYRARALGYYWQRNGMTVIPTLGWSTPDSYDFCFDGIPMRSTVAVSTVGVINSKDSMNLWRYGMDEALYRLDPSRVLVYGKMPDFDFGDVPVSNFVSGIEERIVKWEEEEAARLGQARLLAV